MYKTPRTTESSLKERTEPETTLTTPSERVILKFTGLTAFQLPHLQANLIYLVVGGPCVLTWLYLGESLQNFLIGNQKLERAVYVLLALSMVGSLFLA